MQNQLQVFENKEFGKIRIIDIDGQPWFVGKDVCDVFGGTHYRRSMGALDADERGVTQIDTPGGSQQMVIISESGLYSLLFMMKPTKARGMSNEYISEREARLRGFRRWVTHDVLPSIRKHGAYITEDTQRRLRDDVEYIDTLLNRLADEKDRNTALLGKVERLEPKAQYYDIILQCGNAVQTSIIAKDYGMTAAAFNKLLHGLHVQFKIGDTWLLYKEHAEKGYTLTRTYYVTDKIAKIHTYWTQSGRRFLYDLLKQYGILPEVEKAVGALMGGDDDFRP